MIDSRKRTEQQLLIWFKNIYTDFLQDNKGYANVLDYINGVYMGDKDFWAKIARKAGLRVIKRQGIYFIQA